MLPSICAPLSLRKTRPKQWQHKKRPAETSSDAFGKLLWVHWSKYFSKTQWVSGFSTRLSRVKLAPEAYFTGNECVWRGFCRAFLCCHCFGLVFFGSWSDKRAKVDGSLDDIYFSEVCFSRILCIFSASCYCYVIGTHQPPKHDVGNMPMSRANETQVKPFTRTICALHAFNST